VHVGQCALQRLKHFPSMGRLHRSSSLLDGIACAELPCEIRKPTKEPPVDSHSPSSPKKEKAIAPSPNVDMIIECTCCTLIFRSDDSTAMEDRLGKLIIKFKSNRMATYGDTELLLKSLERVLSSQTEFAVTYDFRNGHPSPKLAMSIGKFILNNKESWSKSATTMALLIRGNIFSACARGLIGNFLQMWLPGYPAIVCHCEHIASEFFMANTGFSTIGSEFVSVVNVQESLPTPSAPSDGNSYCLAFLAPLLIGDTSDVESTLHKLPNGDVRVIQSPADDVMMCSPSTQMLQQPGSGALTVLKFEGSEQDLEQIIGAHFHIGELIADADIESKNRQRASLVFKHRVSAKGCWEGVSSALKTLAVMCEPSGVQRMQPDPPAKPRDRVPQKL